MSDKPKIHVFLGAPPPPPSLLSVPEDGEESGGDQGQWRTMELCWQGDKLKQRLTEAGTQGSFPNQEEPSHTAHSSNHYINMTKTMPHTENETECNEKTNTDHVPVENSPVLGGISNLEKYETFSESIQEYLDYCFPAAQPEPSPEPYPQQSQPSSTPVAASLSVQTEYLSTWTVSQALRLRSRPGIESQQSPVNARRSQTPPKHTPVNSSVSSSSPELYSPYTPSQSPNKRPPQQGSVELFYEPLLSQRLEEGGVVLEFTHDGVLYSQAKTLPEVGLEPGISAATQPLPSSPPPAHTSLMPPALKRSRLSPVVARAAPAQAAVPPHGPTTPLASCVTIGMRHSILVGVVHPCHLKEIQPKSGLSAGNSIPLASIVVVDQSHVEMKVVLWRQAAFWALTVYPGDILLITGVMVHEDKWRGDTVLQSSYASRLLNLGQVTATNSPPVPRNVNGHTLRSLVAFLRARRPLLVSLPPRVPQNPNSLQYARLGFLSPDTLVHARLRVTRTERITAWRPEVEGMSRTGGVQKAFLTVEQGDGQKGAMVLWGAALAWLPRFDRHKDAVWDFHMLLVRESVTSGLLELHSTPWGTCRPLAPNSRQALEFCRDAPGRTSLELDLHTLLSQKYTGDVELKVEITAFQFQGSPSQDVEHPLDSDTPLERLLDTVSGDITFTGCGRCAVELDTDGNGIYCPCYPCLPHTGVRRYYRPVVLTVRKGQAQVQVQVPPALVQKILLDTPPDKLGKTVAPGSVVRHTQIVADRIQALLSRPRHTFLLTVRSQFVCDENSFPTVQDFLLLDFHFQGE